MSDVILSFLIPAGFIVGAAWGACSRAVRVRLEALERWQRPGVITRAMAEVWDEGYSASERDEQFGYPDYERAATENPYRALLEGRS